jgi:hypothetical protein
MSNSLLGRKIKMKKIQGFLAAAFFIIAGSCSSTYHSGSTNTDDVYYSPNNKNQNQQQPSVSRGSSASDYSTNPTQQDNSGTNQQSNSGTSQNQNSDYYGDKPADSHANSNNNYNNDDYYDYTYSSRLRRFYAPVNGYSYYDPYYTNLYWYDYNPYSWGVSIYLGYSWWAPPYYYSSPFCYGGYYNPWYSPCYGGYGYYPVYAYYPVYDYYASPYGYCNPYYYNSYDPTSYYYGPRGTTSSNIRSNTGTRNSTFASRESRTLGDKYIEAVNTGRIIPPSKTDVIPTPNIKNTIVPGSRNNEGTLQQSNPSNEKNNAATRNNGGVTPENHSGNNTFADPTGNESFPNTNAPTKGIITNKNETGKNPVNEPGSRNTNHSIPVQQGPVKNNSINGSGKNNTVPNTGKNNNVKTNRGYSQPTQTSPPERHEQDTRQHENNSQPPAPQQNNDQRRPRQLSNIEQRSGISQPVNPSRNYQPVNPFQGSNPSSHSGNYSGRIESHGNSGMSHGNTGSGMSRGSRRR